MALVNETRIKLPPVVYEDGFRKFVSNLCKHDIGDRVVLDLSEIKHYIPSAILSVVIKFKKWEEEKKSVRIECPGCDVIGYFQRINFFSVLGIDMKENFERHDPSGRFVPISEIDFRTGVLAEDIAQTVLPEEFEYDDPDLSGPYDCLKYSVEELGRNVDEHSNGKGWALAQYTRQTDLVRVCIADSGIGILRSFSVNGSEHWSEEMDELDAIKKALEPGVSSRRSLFGWGKSENAGMGLTLLHGLASKIGDDFVLASRNAFYQRGKGYLAPPEQTLGGTLCSFSFKRSRIRNFFNLLHECVAETGITEEQLDKRRLFNE